ncbi:MAG: M20 family metallopeptidase [Acidimicrobiales bacterium]|nr:M20 family metallopeptidase [Acidimicrobiales bacterium]
MDGAAAKREVCDAVDGRAAALIDISQQIHAHPELAFEETFAHDLLTEAIEGAGLSVERSAFGLDTAFAARAGSSGPNIAVCCEYDALPGLGHACGHNIIAAAGLGAGLAAATVADRLGGQVTILGTPAEEGGGGKVYMIDAGAFADVDAAMMLHPADANLSRMNTIAIHQIMVDYHGKSAHAAAAPQHGRNALDAAVLGYNGVAALRQHIAPDERIHGVFTDGGDKPNIVPQHASMHWYIRSTTLATLEPLKQRVLACLQAGADAAGCTMTYEWKDPSYADMVEVDPMLAAYAANAEALGRVTETPTAESAVIGSTDMGNVSYVVPSIHPMIQVAPERCAIHTPEFASYAASSHGDAAVVDGAKALAMTIVDLWTDAHLLAEAAAAHGAALG